MIGELTSTNAILDRVVHNAHRINFEGDNIHRKDQNKNLTQLKKQRNDVIRNITAGRGSALPVLSGIY